MLFAGQIIQFKFVSKVASFGVVRGSGNYAAMVELAPNAYDEFVRLISELFQLMKPADFRHHQDSDVGQSNMTTKDEQQPNDTPSCRVVRIAKWFCFSRRRWLVCS